MWPSVHDHARDIDGASHIDLFCTIPADLRIRGARHSPTRTPQKRHMIADDMWYRGGGGGGGGVFANRKRKRKVRFCPTTSLASSVGRLHFTLPVAESSLSLQHHLETAPRIPPSRAAMSEVCRSRQKSGSRWPASRSWPIVTPRPSLVPGARRWSSSVRSSL